MNVIFTGLAHANCPVETGTANFWNVDRFDYDIVHIQWPETLFDWRVPTSVELLFLRQRLKEIKRRAKVVYTHHNEVSHHVNESNAAILKGLYSILQTECDAMVHLGETSRITCLADPELKNKSHVVIPIPVYDELYAPYANLTPAASRRKLGLPQDKKVVLAFGNFRFEQEKTLVADAFLGLKGHKAILLAPKWHKPRDYAFAPRHPMLFLCSLRKAAWGWRHNMVLDAKKIVSDEEVATCFSAADVVFIQRLDDLNSGNIPMAFFYKKSVLGPESGNIGEILKATKNPTFNAKDPTSVTAALSAALALSDKGLGIQNHHYAMTHWTSRQASEAHAALYRSLV